MQHRADRVPGHALLAEALQEANRDPFSDVLHNIQQFSARLLGVLQEARIPEPLGPAAPTTSPEHLQQECLQEELLQAGTASESKGFSVMLANTANALVEEINDATTTVVGKGQPPLQQL